MFAGSGAESVNVMAHVLAKVLGVGSGVLHVVLCCYEQCAVGKDIWYCTVAKS